MLPDIDFNNINELIAYIDESIITNHNNEVLAEQHNNIENGLAKFIIEAPRNWSNARVLGTAENYIAQIGECILIFKSTAVGSITLTDNKWNEWTIVNRTTSNKQLVGGIVSYRTVRNTTKNYINPNTALTIAKGEDNFWYEICGSTTTGGADTGKIVTALRKYPQFTVGTAGAPVFTNGGKTLTILDSELLNLITEVIVDVDGQEVPQTFIPNFTDYFAYTPVYSTGRLTLNFNEAVPNFSVGIVRYPVPLTLMCPANVTTLYTGETTDTETVTLLDTNGNIFTVLSGTTYNISINLLCNSTTNEIYAATYILSATNIAGTLTISSPALTELRNDFGYDGNGNPLLVVQVLKDNTLQGVKVVVTGINGFIINYEATFDSKSKTLSNA